MPCAQRGLRSGYSILRCSQRWSAIHIRDYHLILVVDGTTGFTGGRNIDARYWRPALTCTLGSGC